LEELDEVMKEVWGEKLATSGSLSVVGLS
jgi:hypothetical protein